MKCKTLLAVLLILVVTSTVVTASGIMVDAVFYWHIAEIDGPKPVGPPYPCFTNLFPKETLLKVFCPSTGRAVIVRVCGQGGPGLNLHERAFQELLGGDWRPDSGLHQISVKVTPIHQ